MIIDKFSTANQIFAIMSGLKMKLLGLTEDSRRSDILNCSHPPSTFQMPQPHSTPEYLKALEEFNVTASQVILTLLKDENL